MDNARFILEAQEVELVLNDGRHLVRFLRDDVEELLLCAVGEITGIFQVIDRAFGRVEGGAQLMGDPGEELGLGHRSVDELAVDFLELEGLGFELIDQVGVFQSDGRLIGDHLDEREFFFGKRRLVLLVVEVQNTEELVFDQNGAGDEGAGVVTVAGFLKAAVLLDICHQDGLAGGRDRAGDTLPEGDPVSAGELLLEAP